MRLAVTAAAVGGVAIVGAAFFAGRNPPAAVVAPTATPTVDVAVQPATAEPPAPAAAAVLAPTPALAPAAGADAALHPVVRLAQQQARESDANAPRSGTAVPAAPRVDSSALMPFGRTPSEPTAAAPPPRAPQADPMQPNPDLAAATQRAARDLDSLVQSLKEAETKGAAEGKRPN